ncbi:hypothetical protein [Microvirga alba]|nr:hypothetical protein [Microvirga alba]
MSNIDARYEQIFPKLDPSEIDRRAVRDGRPSSGSVKVSRA